MMPPMEFNNYDIHAKIKGRCKIAFVSDFHDRPFPLTIASFKQEKPDIICIVGDLISWHTIRRNEMTFSRYMKLATKHEIYIEECGHLYTSRYAYDFLRQCTEMAPTVYSLGNHEKYFDEKDKEYVRKTGATLLHNNFTRIGELWIGGLSSAAVDNIDPPKIDQEGKTVIATRPKSRTLSEKELRWLDEYEKCNGFKLLLCHHPEYYQYYLKKRNIDLILSGHAHGGQIRIGNRGLFAPGQGFLPKYVSGLYDEKLLVNRGIANVSKNIPRIHNAREIIYIHMIPE